jgi:two-component system, cell cycle response regulator DivK
VGQKILVVEDNELNLKLFCDLLRAHGYETEPVRDGRDAVDRARAFAPDLVVMDIQMPYVSGLELIEQMKADNGLKRTPIMAVTAYAAKGDEERIRDAGAEGYVSKPISVVKFVEAVAGLLAAAAARPPAPEAPAPTESEPEVEDASAQDAAESDDLALRSESPEGEGPVEPDEVPGEVDTAGDAPEAALPLELPFDPGESVAAREVQDMPPPASQEELSVEPKVEEEPVKRRARRGKPEAGSAPAR